MAVGITILTGTRQGEELAFEQAQFRAGDDPECEVFFDREREPAAAGCETLFRLGDDGWYVKKLRGAALMVNDRPIETSTRLRSGDVVQLAPNGPKFTFKLLARMPATASVGRPATPSDANDGLAGRPTMESADGLSQQESSKTVAWRLPVAVAAGIVVGLIALAVVGRRPDRSTTPQAISSTAAPDAKQTASAAPPQPDDDTRAEAKPPKTMDDDADDSDIQEFGDTPPVTQTPKESPADAVFLLSVEEPKSASAWPFGSATAIADHTLLTSATVATGLAGFREKGGRFDAHADGLAYAARIDRQRTRPIAIGRRGGGARGGAVCGHAAGRQPGGSS